MLVDLDEVAELRRRVRAAGGPPQNLASAYAEAERIIDAAPPLGDDLGAWPPLILWAVRIITAAAAGGAAAAAIPSAYRTVGAIENALRWASHAAVAVGILWLWRTLMDGRRR